MATITNTYTGADVDLFHIALRELGDALQWYRFAQANGLSDTVIIGTVQLAVPQKDPTNTGGIPQQ
jgi:hypothetical protein